MAQIVWRKAHEFVLAVYRLTSSFPKIETYGLAVQMRRAAVSIPANIAEGFKRHGKADKARFMNIAEGSLEESRYYLILTQDLGEDLISKGLTEDLMNQRRADAQESPADPAEEPASGRSAWPLYLAEMIGTAALVAVGVSIVILDFGAGSPVAAFIPSAGLRRALTGFLFGSTGALIAISAIGRHSGAHINPVVTLSFWLAGRMRATHAAGYVTAQLAGAVLGSLPLLAWRQMGASVQYGATYPGSGYSDWAALLGEFAATFALVSGLFFFLCRRSIRPYTPCLFPFLYAAMVCLEAPVSGTSTNPARSLGPALIAQDWHAWWVYWAGPAAGAVLALGAYRLKLLSRFEVDVAKLYHFKHDPRGIFHYRRSSPAGR